MKKDSYFIVFLTVILILSLNVSSFGTSQGTMRGSIDHVEIEVGYSDERMEAERSFSQEDKSREEGVKEEGYDPPTNIRTPAEWEDVEEILLRWDSRLDDYYLDMTKEIAEETTARIVTDSEDSAEGISDYLEGNGVKMDNVLFFIVETDSKWMRDYGPISITDMDSGELSLVNMMYDRQARWEDDRFPWRYGRANSIDLYNMTDGEDWFRLEGGNLMVDGAGIFYTTDRCFEQNDPAHGGDLREEEVKEWASDHFSLEKFRHVTRLEDDGHGHIDMQVKLLDETTVLISQLTDENDPDHDILESNARFFEEKTARNGEPYDVVRVPMDKGIFNTYYTYTNSLILNDRVLVPTYGRETDSEALDIYEETMPDHEIVGIDSSSIINQMGAIHCTTMQIAESNAPPSIKIEDVETTVEENVTITANIYDDQGIDSAHVYYNSSVDETLEKREMQPVENDEYRAELPSFSEGTEFQYFIRAKDGSQALAYSGDAWNMHDTTIEESLEVTLNRPDGDEVWEASSEEEIKWTTIERDEPTIGIDLSYSIDGGESWKSIATGVEDTGSFTWEVPDEPSSECLVWAEVYDTAGHTAEDISEDTFTIKRVSPSPPSDLKIEHHEEDHNILEWEQSADDPGPVVEYNIYRSEEENGTYEDIGSIEADGAERYEYIDEDKGSSDDILWWYVVHAVDEHGLECDGTDPVQEPERDHPDRLEIEPKDETIVVGESVSYTATAYDEKGDEIEDVTDETEWWIEEDGHGGNWDNGVYRSENAGGWTVNGRYEGLEEKTNLIVESKEPTYTLTLDSVGEGEVEVEPDKDEYVEGSEVTLRAQSDEGWYFVKWTGDISGAGEEMTIVMDSDKEITAWFKEEVETYELTVEIEGEGDVEIYPEQEEYKDGEEVNLTAEPMEGWYFVGWTGDQEEDKKEITITIDYDHFLRVHFEEVDIEVEILSPREGEVFREDHVEFEWESKDVDNHEIRLNRDRWIDVGQDTSHSFEGLEEGDHLLEVRGRDAMGNEDSEKVNFTVDLDDEDSVVDDEPSSSVIEDHWWILLIGAALLVSITIILSWKRKRGKDLF